MRDMKKCADTIYGMISRSTEKASDAVAITAPGRDALCYRELKSLIEETAELLNEAGLGRGDRVAIVLQNGPEMATAFLSVAAAAIAAPLNPNYLEAGFRAYLEDLRARALIVMADTDSPAVAAAQALRIPVIELAPRMDQAAGLFTLRHSLPPAPKRSGYGQARDVALVLHTSGTTSRPKIVPLTHANLCKSACNIMDSLSLVRHDRCLNIMPLFHIHGLVGALLSSLAASASVACTPGFCAPSFFDWMEECRPTWYTAVPTMHQAIVSRAEAHKEILSRRRLRFLRSCSSSMPPQLLEELASVFGAPVLEAYGMTEASHQISVNPMPPRARKPGSVGLAAGTEIAVMDDEGHLLSEGEQGEIVIRGAGIMSGYAGNPEATREAFTNGWFRTGDQGYLDGDRYLFITGRIKEIINRGGEKIAPREIEEALLDHPDVSQAVGFAVPDKRLGEDVGAAVVVRPGSLLDRKELQRFAFRKLPAFKVPRVIVFLDDLPKGPTGKLQRIGLAERLGIDLREEKTSRSKAHLTNPRTDRECELAGIWKDVLKVGEVDVTMDFLEIGGDSVLALRILSRIRQKYGLELSPLEFFDNPTIAGIAGVLEARPGVARTTECEEARSPAERMPGQRNTS